MPLSYDVIGKLFIHMLLLPGSVLGTGYTAVMLCSWEDNCGHGGK